MCARARQRRRPKGAATSHMAHAPPPWRGLQRTYSCANTPRVGRFARCKCGVLISNTKLKSPVTMLCTCNNAVHGQTLHNAEFAALVAKRIGANAADRSLHVVLSTHTHTCGVEHTYTQATTAVAANTTPECLHGRQTDRRSMYIHRRSQRLQQGLPDSTLSTRGVSAVHASELHAGMMLHVR